MKPGRTDCERKALLATRSLVDRMRAMYRELEQSTGAPITLHRALLCIGEEPRLTASELGHRLGMKRPAVSQVLRSLSRRGWIERIRDAEDQRSVRIDLTPQGRQVLKFTVGRATGILKRAVHSLSAENIEHLAAGIEALLDSLPRDRSVSGHLRAQGHPSHPQRLF